MDDAAKPPSRSFEPEALAKLDRDGYNVLEAIAHVASPTTQTLASPNKFICIDGKTYWIKGEAQQGLVAELIAGRLAAEVGAGPLARIIHVSKAVLPPSAKANQEGVVVGIEDASETINSKDLQPFIASGIIKPETIDQASRAVVVAFQTWIGVGDSQVLVGLLKGTIFSIDHGEAFGATSGLSKPILTIANIPGVQDNLGNEPKFVDTAVSKIQSISDEALLKAVSCVPAGEAWKSPSEKRLEIAKWLAYRRNFLQETMEIWKQR